MRIALFDSGTGGLTVLSHARRVLPSEEFLFFADRDHVPYGTKSVQTVRGYVRAAFRFLVEKQRADAVVVACNTATSVAVEEMRQIYDVPIIGMEPAVKKALAQDGERRVLVTATPIRPASQAPRTAPTAPRTMVHRIEIRWSPLRKRRARAPTTAPTTTIAMS